MKLYELNRGPKDNKYCGPAVLSFISGLNTTDAAALIRESNPCIERVKGVYPNDLLRAFRAAGFNTVRRPLKGATPTLKTWLRENKADRSAGRVYLLVAGNHFQLITGRKYACGRIGEIVPLSDKRIKNRARVTEVYEVYASTEQRYMTKCCRERMAKKKAHLRQEGSQIASARRRAHKIAREYEMTIEVDRFPGGTISIYFNVPEWLEEARDAGKIDYVSYAYDWFEAEDVARGLEEAIIDGQRKMLDCEDA